MLLDLGKPAPLMLLNLGNPVPLLIQIIAISTPAEAKS